MQKIAMAIHGGAGPDSDSIPKNKTGYEEALKRAATVGYKVVERGGSAVDAVEEAVKCLENNYLDQSCYGIGQRCTGTCQSEEYRVGS